MEAVFGWLGSIFDLLLSLFPHLITVDANQIGVKFPRGKRRKILFPGLHWYWPLVTNEPVVITTAVGTIELDAQSLTAKDGWPVRVAMIVKGHVMSDEESAYRSLVETDDIGDAMNDIALRACGPIVQSRTFDEFCAMIEDGSFESLITERIRVDAAEHGYHVLRAFPASYTRYIPHGDPD